MLITNNDSVCFWHIRNEFTHELDQIPANSPIKLLGLLLLILSLLGCQTPTTAISKYCSPQRDLALVNGNIHTMNAHNDVVSSVLIKNGVFAALDGSDYTVQPCTDVIDLQGNTVIPGLVDNHVHFVRIQNRPGLDIRELESTFSVGEALSVLSDEAEKAADGELLTTIGGIRRWQWAENRFPTMQELDDAVPNNPVYLSEFGFGPGQTNTSGRDLLRSLGAVVADDGSIGQREDTAKAYEVLAQSMNDEDRKRQLKNIIAWANGVGLTTVFDMSGTVPGVGFLDQRVGYNPIADLDREGALNLRTRLFFPGLDTDADLTLLQNRLDNSFANFGSLTLKTIGVGEWSVGRSLFNSQPLMPAAVDAQKRIAERGWPYHQHLHSPAEIDAHLDIWEQLDPDYDLSELRWTAGHLSGIGQEPQLIERIVALGLGIGAHGQPYSARQSEENLNRQAGPPWRSLIEAGAVATGGGSDGARISPFNPWSIIYYMVTGVNSAGQLVNAEQTISREQAVRLYTSTELGWFTKEESQLGGIEVGRYADLAVLSKNVFDSEEVSDADIRKMTSSLTILGGRIVHSDGSLTSNTSQ